VPRAAGLAETSGRRLLSLPYNTGQAIELLVLCTFESAAADRPTWERGDRGQRAGLGHGQHPSAERGSSASGWLRCGGRPPGRRRRRRAASLPPRHSFLPLISYLCPKLSPDAADDQSPERAPKRRAVSRPTRAFAAASTAPRASSLRADLPRPPQPLPPAAATAPFSTTCMQLACMPRSMRSGPRPRRPSTSLTPRANRPACSRRSGRR
jgi:hypothetical protein